MGQSVKRQYDSSRRAARSRATRAAVVEAARELFLDRGYPATTVDAIADASGVPIATVYRLFGSKPRILAAVLDIAFGGDDEPVSFHQRPVVQAALADPDPGALLDAFARICRELLDRSAPIQRVLATAAAVDAEAAEQLATTRAQRHTGQSRVVKALARRGALTPALGQAEAADIVYTLMSPEVHGLLTVERGWSGRRYEKWLAASLRQQLLGG